MYKVIFISLLINALYSQSQFDVIIATGQNNISGISHPAIEVGDSIYAFIKTDYRYSYGFPTSLVKLNKQGTILSNMLYLDTSNPFRIFDVYKEKKEVLICGIKILRDSGSRILMYGLLNNQMDTMWTRTISSTNNHPGVYKIIRLSNSNILLIGDDSQISPTGGTYQKGNSAIFILTDSIGNILKYLHFPKKDSASLEGLDYAMQTRTGDIYCVGTIKNGTAYFKGLILKLSKDGELIWRKEIEKSAFGYYLRFCKELSNGNIQIIGAKYKPFFLDDSQVWASSIEMDSDGKVISERNIFNEHLTYYYYCTEDKYGNIVCASAVAHDDSTSARGYMIKLNSNGDSIWKREFTHGWKDRDEIFTNIANADDGGYYLTGYNWVQGDNSSKAWIVKVDSNGCVVPGCNTAVNVEPQEYDLLFLLYPNPVQDKLIIYLNDETRAEKKYIFECYDQNGRMVFEKRISGMKSVVDMSFLNSGMYFYRIHDSRKVVQSGKMVKV